MINTYEELACYYSIKDEIVHVLIDNDREEILFVYDNERIEKVLEFRNPIYTTLDLIQSECESIHYVNQCIKNIDFEDMEALGFEPDYSMSEQEIRNGFYDYFKGGK